MTNCPFCKDSVQENESVFCPSCEAPHHQECWEENGAVCSVFGCESKFQGNVLGCPWCDEVYIHGETQVCLSCGSSLMAPDEFQRALEGSEWTRLELTAEQNPMFACGFLRNNGVTARLEKRPGVAMLMALSPGLLVAREEEAFARRLLSELAAQFSRCHGCGHVLAREEVCTYCVESGAEL